MTSFLNESPAHRLYRVTLEKAIRDHQVKLVAEEFSKDALDMRSLWVQQEYFTKRVADGLGLGVEHLLWYTPVKIKYERLGCQGYDGWFEQLDQFGLKSNFVATATLARALDVLKDHPLREEYWFEQIKGRLNQDLVFVCGDYHLDTFGARLSAKAVQSTVVERSIGVEQPLMDDMIDVKEYLGQNEQEVEDTYLKILSLNLGKIPPPSFYRQAYGKT